MYSLPCVIFAGGKSSRMGRDKALLPFKNHSSLAEFQYERMKRYFKEVYISCKSEEKFPFKASFLQDNSDIYSPLVAIDSIFGKLNRDFFALSVDTPFFRIEEFERLLDVYKKFENADAVVAKTDNIHPLCSIYKRSIVPKVKEALKKEKHKLRAVLDNSNTVYVDFEDNSRFLNLNYPKDYDFARRISDG